ncbi:hypothetical protein SCLCIDRAFT_193335 [Scleroderma citrinum Foug A]|uniref:Uncharacterized protein n=1 Tax=Scleroderma citrinum Foug A TaxID=1036808 RepID=A0A0C2ZX09_9AGAM|nr:hypothetical protein SCLCIDRAFT_193335 [Scleroderma citrinum Foug A]
MRIPIKITTTYKNRGMTVHTVGVARRMSPGYTIRNKPWQRRTMKWQASSSPPPHSIIHFGLLFFCSSIRHSSHICWFLGCIGCRRAGDHFHRIATRADRSSDIVHPSLSPPNDLSKLTEHDNADP